MMVSGDSTQYKDSESEGEEAEADERHRALIVPRLKDRSQEEGLALLDLVWPDWLATLERDLSAHKLRDLQLPDDVFLRLSWAIGKDFANYDRIWQRELK